MVETNPFCKTICSICYEDLKPIVEDLQAISVCGHVFHELCLQQWFEYSALKKKNSCPVCKQICSKQNVGRLYFQSIGDQNDEHQKGDCQGEDPKQLSAEVKRLEVKVTGLNSALECYKKDLKVISDELSVCKEKARIEANLKDTALREKAFIQQLLQSKSGELDKTVLECLRLQERNMALAKELAAIKLVSDLNLEEEEVLKLASLGNGGNNKDTIDILKKSLVIRNKSYKELMAKCNLLGRGEARSIKNLEKAKEKISKLKIRVQELETAIEIRDNEGLRTLIGSKEAVQKSNFTASEQGNCHLSSTAAKSSDDLQKEAAHDYLSLRETDNFKDILFDDARLNVAEKDSCFRMDVDLQEFVTIVDEKYSFCLQSATDNNAFQNPKSGLTDCERETPIHGLDDVANSLIKIGNNDSFSARSECLHKDGQLLFEEMSEVQSFIHIRKEQPGPVPLALSGDGCFSGGLLGPDGTNRHLGKWCKRSLVKESISSSLSIHGESKPCTDGVIAVGADGRGGKIKVLRSLNQSLDDKETSISAKRCKKGTKASSLQSRGCLQIEHFFTRAGN